MLRNAWLPILAGFAFAYMVWHVSSNHEAAPVPVPPVQPSRSPFAENLAASGLVEPRSETVSIGTEVPGVIVEVAVTEGQTVKKGDRLFRLDDRQRRAEVKVAEASLRAAKAQLQRLNNQPRTEDIPPSEANLRRAQADVKLQQDNVLRIEDLFGRKVSTERELVQAQQAFAMAQAMAEQADAEHQRLLAGAWEEDLLIQQTNVEQAEARLAQAQVEVDRLEIQAPTDGTILTVNVRPGEFVGSPSSTALIRMGDLSRLHVRIDIDENDLPRFRPGLPGVGYARGDSTDAIPLTYVRTAPFTLPKQFLTGAGDERVDTRVLQVIYAVEPTNGKLPTIYVGQQMDVYLDRATEKATPDSSTSGQQEQKL